MISESCIEGDKTEYHLLLPMCEKKNRETLEDLFNPLYVGFQILKRGFCLAYNNGDLDSNVINKYPRDYNDPDFASQMEKKYGYVNDINYISSSWEGAVSGLFNSKEQQLTEAFPFEVSTDFSFPVPVLSPTGFCINDGYLLHFLENKKITCSYMFKCGNFNSNLQNLKLELKPNNTRLYEIKDGMIELISDSQDETPTDSESENGCEKVIKKIELLFYYSGENYSDYFYDQIVYYQTITIQNDIKFIDVTYEFSFLKLDITNYPRSGNPGYLKSKDIITGETNTYTNPDTDVSTKYVNIHKTKSIFHYNSGGQCLSSNAQEANRINLYYNDILDNSLTFEDGIIFGCWHNGKIDNNVLTLNPLTQFEYSNEEYEKYITISKFGNPKMNKDDFLNYDNFKYDFSSTECTGETCSLNIPTLNILYVETGATNNVQNSIIYVKVQSEGKVTVKQNEDNYYPLYTKVNFFKHTPNKKWWYAPGPGFIKLPRNVMYPFRIGTTTYQEKNSGN